MCFRWFLAQLDTDSYEASCFCFSKVQFFTFCLFFSAAANQAPNLNAMGSAGVFGNLNAGANMMGSGFNAAMAAQVQPQMQPLQNQMQSLQPQMQALQQQQQQQQRVGSGYSTGMGNQQGGGYGSFGGMQQSPNIGTGPAGMGQLGGVGPANSSGYPPRNTQPARPSQNISRNSSLPGDRRPDNGARYSPGPVPAPYSTLCPIS